jgi:hypothetical protein
MNNPKLPIQFWIPGQVSGNCVLLTKSIEEWSLINRRPKQVLPGGISTSGRGKRVGKGHGRVNIVQIQWTHVCKWKIIPVETIPRMEGWRKMVEGMNSSIYLINLIYLINYKNFYKGNNVPLPRTIKKNTKSKKTQENLA